MKSKTISCHYDTVYELAHNNRIFIPQNVDSARTKWNYNCVVAGGEAYLDFTDPRHVQEFWYRYHELSDLYWKNLVLAKELEYEHHRETVRYLWKCRQMLNYDPENIVEAFFAILLLPLTIFADSFLLIRQIQEELKHAEFKSERALQNREFYSAKLTAREILRQYDQQTDSSLLVKMDAIMRETALLAGNLADASQPVDLRLKETERFATLEEIYDKLYEPYFQTFQLSQRPCRRYNGSYLDFIREGQREMVHKKSQNKNVKNRKPAEAIELVIGIGDKYNTGYCSVLEDAQKAEALLKDYCDHLMQQSNVCFVTTTELASPNWRPPFKHGLIVLNLVVHADESCPGIHLTVIPYSSNCTRGPQVQASLGSAMRGMGYPSTWKDVLNQNGEKIPKRNKNNEIIYNKDGSIRYRQEPDKRGIIDWIEDQKNWIHQEMLARYGWEREYKGSHPRGNLSTPDYQAARALERLQEFERQIGDVYTRVDNHIDAKIEQLNSAVDTACRDSTTWEMLLCYLNICPDEEYNFYVKIAGEYLASLPQQAKAAAKKQLDEIIATAAKKAEETKPQGISKNKVINSL